MSNELDNLPLVPLRDMVVFPSMMAPFVVGRRASIQALEATLATAEVQTRLAELRLIDRATPVRPTDAIAAVDA